MNETTTPSAGRRVPHVRLLDFLEPDDYDALLEHVAARLDDTSASSTVDPETLGARYDETIRRSRIVSDVDLIWPRFEDRLLALLPRLRDELGIEDFPLGSVERQLTLHADGDFFTHHRDENNPRTDGCRMITFVYYFHAEPKRFEGGQLRLYDVAEDRRGVVRRLETYTELEPVANSILFFPADADHEVVPVRSTGTGPGTRRCTVNGWFHAGDLGRPPIPRVTPETMAALTPRYLPRLTEHGFEVRATPPPVQRLLTTVLGLWEQSPGAGAAPADDDLPDDADPPDDRPEHIPTGPFGDEILERLRPVHEEWAGVPLRPIVSSPVLVYRSGQREPLHIRPPGTDVVSSLVVIAEDLDTSWPFVLDLGDDHREVPVGPGEMVLFEGAAIPHGHPSPLVGRSHALVLLHYCPVAWPHSPESVVRRALADGVIDDRGRLEAADASTPTARSASSGVADAGLEPLTFASSTGLLDD